MKLEISYINQLFYWNFIHDSVISINVYLTDILFSLLGHQICTKVIEAYTEFDLYFDLTSYFQTLQMSNFRFPLSQTRSCLKVESRDKI